MAIIGISGKIGSGKDTVGMIIQTHMAKQSLPDLRVEEVIKDPSEYSAIISAISTYKIKKFAGKLKQVASLLTGIPIEKFEDQEFKKTSLGPEWNYWTISVIDNGKLLFQHGRYDSKKEAEDFIPFLKENYGEFRMEYVAGMQRMTVRQFLQELGTDACRVGLHPNTWVNALMAGYQPLDYNPITEAEIYPNWIITDTRFTNEAEAIKSRGGIIIRVDNKNKKDSQTHSSETALDNWEFDYVIDNSGSIKELSGKVYDMLRHFDIIPAPAANH